jgi:hypothetical protein
MRHPSERTAAQREASVTLGAERDAGFTLAGNLAGRAPGVTPA